MQKYFNNFQKILIKLLNVGKKVEEKTRALVLLLSLLLSYESLVTAFLMEKNTIKMEKIISALLENEVLRQENRASSSGGDSTMMVSKGDGSRRRSGRRS